MSLGLAEDHIKSSEMTLIDYNHSLEKQTSSACLNEGFLEKKIGELEEIAPIRKDLYCLTLARLNELTLLCAGNYADNLEFTAAGDLLVNPRLILVHIRNQTKPVAKERHSRITDQFRNIATSGKDVIQWLKRETFLEIKKEPLLPYLYESLKKSGFISQAYLRSAEARMKKIADVIILLCSLHLPNRHDFHQWLQHTTRSEREFVKSSLCRFDMQTFKNLGKDLYQIIPGGRYKGEFLCC